MPHKQPLFGTLKPFRGQQLKPFRGTQLKPFREQEQQQEQQLPEPKSRRRRRRFEESGSVSDLGRRFKSFRTPARNVDFSAVLDTVEGKKKRRAILEGAKRSDSLSFTSGLFEFRKRKLTDLRRLFDRMHPRPRATRPLKRIPLFGLRSINKANRERVRMKQIGDN